MKKIKKFLKKSVAMLMALAAAVSVFPEETALAASERAAISFKNCYDSEGNVIRFQQSVYHDGRECGEAGEARTRIYADGEPAYCIQPGVSLHSGDTLQADASDAWNALSADQRNAVKLALLYGAQGSLSELPGTEDEKVIATQLIVWELASGCRNATAPYGRNDSKFFDGLCADGANSGVAAAYNQIVSRMAAHDTIPSFASGSMNGTAKELKWDGGKYVLKLEDANGVLSQFDFTSSNSNVKVSVSGNTLTITSATAVKDEVRLSAAKRVPTVSASANLVAYGDVSLQDVITGVENADAVNMYLNVKTPYGHIKIVKTSEDGIVGGLKFHISGNGVDQTVVTGKDGTMEVKDLVPGTYTVTEITEERYETQKAQKVTVTGGQTAKVEFSNILKRGSLKVTKTSEDGFVEGVKFHLYGTSLSSAKVDEYALTDRSGVATFSNVLISGTSPYTLEEVDMLMAVIKCKKMAVKFCMFMAA